MAEVQQKGSTSSTPNNCVNEKITVNNNDISVANLNINSHTKVESHTLESAAQECQEIFGLFMGNKFEEALQRCDKWKDVSIYHAFLKACFKAMIGIITLEEPQLEEGKQYCKEVLDYLSTRRKQTSLSENISSFFWKVNFEDYTDEELHAEVMTAFLNLAWAVLTIFSEQTFLAFVKAGLRIRSSYQSYKFCDDALKNRKQWDSEYSRNEYEAASEFGIGAFNMLISHMPSKVLKLISILGYPCDREKGITLIRSVLAKKDTLHRNFIGYLAAAFYFLYMEPIFGMNECQFGEIEPLVDEQLKKYAGGCLPLLLKGRIEELKGNPEDALVHYIKSIESQNIWIQLNNVCYWDMIWCYAIQCNWEKAAEYARILVKQCKWSPSTNCYQDAVFSHLHAKENKLDKKDEIMEIMKKVNGLRLHFAGKSLPPEKFAGTKAEKFVSENGDIPIPAIELFHVWSILTIAGGKEKYLKPILDIIEKDLQEFKKKYEAKSEENVTPFDKYALCLLMKGVCLRYMNKFEDALRCLQEVINNGEKLVYDMYILPNAYCEIGFTYIKLKRYDEAKVCLETSKNNYTGYLMETMVHLRAHNGLRFVKDVKKSSKEDKKLLKRAFTLF